VHVTILSARPDLYSTKRLVETAQVRGHSVDVVNYKRCVLGLTAGRPVVIHDGKEIATDVVIPRLGATSSRFGAAVVRQLEAAGVPTTVTAGAVLRSRDKLAALQALVAAGVPVPQTAAAREPSVNEDVLALIDSLPVVVKLLESSAGHGVVLGETKKAAKALLSAFHQLEADFLVQEFVAEAGGVDVRALVVDGDVVAAMSRRAAPGDFRSNLHQGGVAEPVRLDRREKRAAVDAAKTLGLSVAGVDIIRSDRGPLVLEVNVSPGLQGVERASGVDVAGSILDFAERLNAGDATHRRTRPGRRRR
jgi:ribosomal protein S6--L-glutamate ligase